MSLLGPSAWKITIVLGAAFGVQNSRIIRGVALSIKEHTFVNMLGDALRDLLDPRLKGG
jgi:ABC-type dipeptide/oligopeptide/nickel transport system permease subunit